MGKKSGSSIFWISFSDLMTSLFFIVLVLFVVTYVDNVNKLRAKEEQLRVYREVEESLKPLKHDNDFFKYEEEYKRFLLAFDVKFTVARAGINATDLDNFEETKVKIINAGQKLKAVLDQIVIEASEQNEHQKNKVTYLVVISGYASKLHNADISPIGMSAEYQLSYARAYSLWKFWLNQGINLEDPKYNGLIDLQIAGNGWGGVGRMKNNEEANQRFIVQVVPKISNQELTNPN